MMALTSNNPLKFFKFSDPPVSKECRYGGYLLVPPACCGVSRRQRSEITSINSYRADSYSDALRCITAR